MKLQNNFQPDIPSKAVSTLLEILAKLRSLQAAPAAQNFAVSTLLEILEVVEPPQLRGLIVFPVSTLLEILVH